MSHPVHARNSISKTGRAYYWWAATVLILASAVSCLADLKHKPWIEKDWTNWSSTDCLYVRYYSPWVSYNGGHGRETGPGIEPDAYGDSTWIQLLSALPIREGKLRELQITKSYSRMNPDRKEAFDREHSADLSENANDPIRIRVEHRRSTVYDSDYNEIRDDSSTVAIRQAALVLSNGALIIPSRIIADKPTATPEGTNAATYLFPRAINGKPLYSSTDTFLTIVFGCGLKFQKNHLEAQPQDFGTFHRDCGLGDKKEDFSIESLNYKGKVEY